MSHEIDPQRLVAALAEAGWVQAGPEVGNRMVLRFGEHTSVMVPLDPTDADFRREMRDALWTLERLEQVGRAADRALTLATCSCEGRRWVDDEGWQAEYHMIGGKFRREPGNGLIPCGFCNEGGWDVEPVEVKTA